MWISGTSDGFLMVTDPKPTADSGPFVAERARVASSREEAKAIEVAEELGAHEFGRMVLLVRSNDRLFEELRSNRSRIVETQAYLGRPDANQALGWARMERLRDRHSAILARLRANRIEGRRLLAQFEAPKATQALMAC